MLNLKKSFVSLLLVATVLLSCLSLAALNVSATEAPAVDDNSNITIYYFYDLFPTLSESDLTEAFSNGNSEVNIVYCKCILDEALINILLGEGYLNDQCNYIVVVDIKTFYPSSDHLESIFYTLKAIYSFSTVFVTPLSETDFANNYFFEYVDAFIDGVSYSVYDDFLYDTFLYLDCESQSYTNTVYILDETWINGLGNSTFEVLCANNPCLQIFLSYLLMAIDDNSISLDHSYEEIKAYFLDHNIILLVRMSENEYIDIVSGATYNITNSSAYCNYFGDYPCYALGFWRLSTPLYNLLLDIQQNSSLSTFYVFIYPVDPIVYDPDGLSIITCGTGNTVLDPSAEDVLGVLNNLVSGIRGN